MSQESPTREVITIHEAKRLPQVVYKKEELTNKKCLTDFLVENEIVFEEENAFSQNMFAVVKIVNIQSPEPKRHDWRTRSPPAEAYLTRSKRKHHSYLNEPSVELTEPLQKKSPVKPRRLTPNYHFGDYTRPLSNRSNHSRSPVKKSPKKWLPKIGIKQKEQKLSLSRSPAKTTSLKKSGKKRRKAKPKSKDNSVSSSRSPVNKTNQSHNMSRSNSGNEFTITNDTTIRTETPNRSINRTLNDLKLTEVEENPAEKDKNSHNDGQMSFRNSPTSEHAKIKDSLNESNQKKRRSGSDSHAKSLSKLLHNADKMLFKGKDLGNLNITKKKKKGQSVVDKLARQNQKLLDDDSGEYESGYFGNKEYGKDHSNEKTDIDMIKSGQEGELKDHVEELGDTGADSSKIKTSPKKKNPQKKFDTAGGGGQRLRSEVDSLKEKRELSYMSYDELRELGYSLDKKRVSWESNRDPLIFAEDHGNHYVPGIHSRERELDENSGKLIVFNDQDQLKKFGSLNSRESANNLGPEFDSLAIRNIVNKAYEDLFDSQGQFRSGKESIGHNSLQSKARNQQGDLPTHNRSRENSPYQSLRSNGNEKMNQRNVENIPREQQVSELSTRNAIEHLTEHFSLRQEGQASKFEHYSERLNSPDSFEHKKPTEQASNFKSRSDEAPQVRSNAGSLMPSRVQSQEQQSHPDNFGSRNNSRKEVNNQDLNELSSLKARNDVGRDEYTLENSTDLLKKQFRDRDFGENIENKYNDTLDANNTNKQTYLSSEMGKVNRSLEPAERISSKTNSQGPHNYPYVQNTDYGSFKNPQNRYSEEGDFIEGKVGDKMYGPNYTQENRPTEQESSNFEYRNIDDPVEWARQQIERIKKNDQGRDISDSAKPRNDIMRPENQEIDPSDWARQQIERIKQNEQANRMSEKEQVGGQTSLKYQSDSKQETREIEKIPARTAEELAREQLERIKKEEEAQVSSKSRLIATDSPAYPDFFREPSEKQFNMDKHTRTPKGEESETTQQSTYRQLRPNKTPSEDAEGDLAKRLADNLASVASDLKAQISKKDDQGQNPQSQDKSKAQNESFQGKREDSPGKISEKFSSAQSKESAGKNSDNSPSKFSDKDYGKNFDKILGKKFGKRKPDTAEKDIPSSGSKVNADSENGSNRSLRRDLLDPLGRLSSRSPSKKSDKSLENPTEKSSRDTPSPPKKNIDNALVMSILKKREGTPSSQISGEGSSPAKNSGDDKSSPSRSSLERSTSSKYKRRNRETKKKPHFLGHSNSKDDILAKLKSSINQQHLTPEDVEELAEISYYNEKKKEQKKAEKPGRNQGKESKRPVLNLKKLREAERVFENRHKEKGGDFQNNFNSKASKYSSDSRRESLRSNLSDKIHLSAIYPPKIQTEKKHPVQPNQGTKNVKVPENKQNKRLHQDSGDDHTFRKGPEHNNSSQNHPKPRRNHQDYSNLHHDEDHFEHQEHSPNRSRILKRSRSPDQVHRSDARHAKENIKTPIKPGNRDTKNVYQPKNFHQDSSTRSPHKPQNNRRKYSPPGGIEKTQTEPDLKATKSPYDHQPKHHFETMASHKSSPYKGQDKKFLLKRDNLFNTSSNRARTDIKDYVPSSKKPAYTISPFLKQSTQAVRDPTEPNHDQDIPDYVHKRLNLEDAPKVQKHEGDRDEGYDDNDYVDDEENDHSGPEYDHDHDQSIQRTPKRRQIKQNSSLTPPRSRSPFQRKLDDDYLLREYQRICLNLVDVDFNIHDRLVLEEHYQRSLEILLQKCQSFSTVDFSAYLRFLVRAAKRNYIQHMKNYFTKLKQDTYMRTYYQDEDPLEEEAEEIEEEVEGSEVL